MSMTCRSRGKARIIGLVEEQGPCGGLFHSLLTCNVSSVQPIKGRIRASGDWPLFVWPLIPSLDHQEFRGCHGQACTDAGEEDGIGPPRAISIIIEVAIDGIVDYAMRGRCGSTAVGER